MPIPSPMQKIIFLTFEPLISGKGVEEFDEENEL
jgi:hypothetical protein